MKKLFFLYLILVMLAGFTFTQEIRVLLPNGGEKWVFGDSKVIRWSSSGLSNNVKIVLFKDGSRLGLIASDLNPGTGLFSWIVGSYQEGKPRTGTGFRIKIKEMGTAIGDMSDEDFSIIEKKKKSEPKKPKGIPATIFTSIDIVVEDIVISNRSPYPLIIHLRNNGNMATGFFQVTVEWRRHNPPMATATYNNNFSTVLGTNDRREWAPGINLKKNKLYMVKVTADSGQTVTETNENNNQMAKLVSTIEPFDLKVKDVTRHRNNHPDVNIKFKVKNVGHQESPSYRIIYSFKPRSGNQETNSQSLFSETYNGLEPDSVRQHVISNQLLPGKWKLRFMASPDGSENNLSNNSGNKDYNK